MVGLGITHPVVLLDWQLVGQHRQHFATLLTDNNLTEQTLLLSATMDDARKQFITKHSLAGYRLKPLDLERFEEEIGLSEQCAIHKSDYEAIFNSIEVAINILDGNLDEFLSNTRAKKEPLTVSQRLIVKWLRTEIEDKKHKAARRLDWDGNKNCFLESGLFKLNDGNYWLARDWRIEGERPHDHEILNLENVHTLKDWLGSVARLLAQRYAISRFRVYKVAPLPHIKEINGFPDNRLVIPYFQSGGGFEPNEEVWYGTGFLVNKNIHTEKALRIDYKSQPEAVNDANPNTGCESIRFGEKNTYRVLFPVRGQDGRVSALFALDRRFDHAGTLAGFDREVVETAKRMASDDAGALSSEQWSLMKGLIQDLGERLAVRLTIQENDRTRDWHKTISKILKSTLAEAGRSPEMIYDGLSRVCAGLAEKWNEKDISGHVMGTTPWPKSNRSFPISAWYIGLMTDETHWQAVAGWGAAYEACRQYGKYELTEPHKTAKTTSPWKAAVVQDFQKWTQREANHSYHFMTADQFTPISAWLAVPIQVDGSVRALMVVHSPHAHYFTTFRANLMENTAEQLLSLLAAAQRETRARSMFAASVMHEVKNDSHTALMILDHIQRETSYTAWATSLAEIRHYLEGLNTLGQDTLDLFQLGRGDHIPDKQEPEKDLFISLDNLIKSATLGWRTLYEDTALDIQMPKTFFARKVLIKRRLAFKRVLRVLLHNAFRHGRQRVSVQVTLESREAGRENYLNITVINLADEQSIKNLTEKLNPVIGGLGSSPFIRGRLGLAVAHQLATEAGGFLSDLKPLKTDSDSIEAIISLTWPITFVDDTLESTS